MTVNLLRSKKKALFVCSTSRVAPMAPAYCVAGWGGSNSSKEVHTEGEGLHSFSNDNIPLCAPKVAYVQFR